MQSADPYMRIVMFFDQDETAGAFLREDGDGGFAGAMYRMSREIDRLRTGIKRLSDEEELCAETTGDDPFSMVYLAAKLAQAEADARGVQIALEQSWESNRERQAEIERLRLALTDVVNPLGNLKRYAEERDSTLVGGAYSIANNLNFVQQIAKAALEAPSKSSGKDQP